MTALLTGPGGWGLVGVTAQGVRPGIRPTRLTGGNTAPAGTDGVQGRPAARPAPPGRGGRRLGSGRRPWRRAAGGATWPGGSAGARGPASVGLRGVAMIREDGG